MSTAYVNPFDGSPLDGLGNKMTDYCDDTNYNTFPCNMDNYQIVSMSFIGGVICLVMVVYLYLRLQTFERGNETMKKLSDSIAAGSRSFFDNRVHILVWFLRLCGHCFAAFIFFLH